MEKLPPTSRRRTELKKSGNVAVSGALTQSIQVIALVALGSVFLARIWVEAKMLLEYLLIEGFSSPRVPFAFVARLTITKVLMPLCCIAVLGLGVQLLQVGLLCSMSAVVPDVRRVSPCAGLKRVLREFGVSWLLLLRVAIFSSMLLLLWVELLTFCALAMSAGPVTFATVSGVASNLQRFLFLAVIVDLCCGAIDQRIRARRWLRDNGMTSEEIRREHREDEGDPHLKAYRQQLRRFWTAGDIVDRVRRSRIVLVSRGDHGAQ